MEGRAYPFGLTETEVQTVCDAQDHPVTIERDLWERHLDPDYIARRMREEWRKVALSTPRVRGLIWPTVESRGINRDLADAFGAGLVEGEHDFMPEPEMVVALMAHSNDAWSEEALLHAIQEGADEFASCVKSWRRDQMDRQSQRLGVSMTLSATSG